MANKKPTQAKEPKRYKFESPTTLRLDLRGIRIPGRTLNGIPNPGRGNRPKFRSPEELKAEVDGYFETLMRYKFDRNGNLLIDPKGNPVREMAIPPTISGLARYLGVSTMSLSLWKRGVLDGYETNDELTFSAVVADAKQRIEEYAEGRMYDREGQRGAEYILKTHYGWVTPQEAAAIYQMKVDAEVKKRMFELKKSLLDSGIEDENLTINIVRKTKEE